MTDFNSIVLCGRITKDLETKGYGVTTKGTAKLSFSIAVNRSEKKGEEWHNVASFFDVVIWGKGAEIMRSYVQKGRGGVVFGSLRQDRWTAPNGKSMSKIYILAESIKVLEKSSKTELPAEVQTVANVFQGDGFPEDVPF